MGTPNVAIVCVLKSGGVYTPEWVKRLQAQVKPFMPKKADFICLTDYDPQKLYEVEKFRAISKVPLVHNLPGFWSKIELFKPGQFEGYDKVLYLDLDTIVLSKLKPFFDATEEFSIAPVKMYDEKKANRCIGYQSSIMCWKPGTRDFIFNNFKFGDISRWYGDQDMLRAEYPDEKTFPEDWVLKYEEPHLNKEQPPKGPKIVLCIRPKNNDLAKEYAWVRSAWGDPI